MARPGIYIQDVQLLTQLHERIIYSGEAMSKIDQNVINYILGVNKTLEKQLHQIQMKLTEAESRLSNAERAEAACHARQHRNKEGNLVPSCSLYENATMKAQKEAEKWRSRYQRAQQIMEECQQETHDYLTGGHNLILNMCEQQMPKASNLLCDCINKLQRILDYNIIFRNKM